MNALNLSRGGLYHHFSSKEEILDTAIAALLLSERKRVGATFDNNKLSAIDKLKLLIEFDSSAQPMANEVVTIVSAKENPTLITHLLRKKLEVITPLFTSIIEQGNKEGLFHCNYPEEASKISIILSTLLFTDTILNMSSNETVKMIELFQHIIEAMVEVEPGTFNFMKESIKIENSGGSI